ncbi:VIT1/CCC1 transporter family protein [Ferroacidibacillus organovorans]|uniref:VIT1/CCC1 transporter family protein n=1 Tax=Ferroacidibacillus organovorans TaxID=1765683 RepID=UPI000AC3BB12|nr:VIT1/CCC1 transporter family protein [Ferroacidibacillus organovorans]
MSLGTQDRMVKKTLLESWRREMDATRLYAQAAALEKDSERKSILLQLSKIEQTHAEMWARKLAEIGEQAPASSYQAPPVDHASSEQLLKRLDELEHSNAAWYESLKHVFEDPEILQIIDQIDEDESNHDSSVRALFASPSTHIGERLSRLWGAERWHKQSAGGWVGDAIYGVNDGLGAIFGIISGVAGYTDNGHTVLVSGLFGAIASTLSMGVGAWLSTRSKNELAHSELHFERKEIMENPELEKEELRLLYQLKGFTENEAAEITERLSKDPEQFLKAMSQEELGITDEGGNPWTSAGIGSLSTFVGGILPLIPFFFTGGVTAIVLAAIVSIAAHFAVGAAKSLITVRRWWTSGLEMTAAGILVGIVAYGIGLLGSTLIHG